MIDLVLRSVLTPGVLAARWAGLAQLPASIADVPATRWSVGLATKMIMDEIFFLTEALSIQLVSVRDRRRIDGESPRHVARPSLRASPVRQRVRAACG
jgi:hypothetical protein